MYSRNLGIFKMYLKFYYSIIKMVILILNKDLTEASLSLNMISFFMSFIRPANLAGEKKIKKLHFYRKVKETAGDT